MDDAASIGEILIPMKGRKGERDSVCVCLFVSRKRERDAVLVEEGKVGVGRVVKNSGGEETASGGDKGWGGAEGGFGRDEFVTKKRGKREREVEGVIVEYG